MITSNDNNEEVQRVQDALQRERRWKTNSMWKEGAKFISCRPASFGYLTPYGIVYIDYVFPKNQKSQSW